MVFSDKDKNSRSQAVTSTSTNLTLVEQKKAIHWQTRYLGLRQCPALVPVVEKVDSTIHWIA